MNNLCRFDSFASLSGVFLRVGLPGKLLGQRCDLPVVSVTGHAEQYGTESRRHVRSQRGSAGAPPRSSHPHHHPQGKRHLLTKDGLCCRTRSGPDRRILVSESVCVCDGPGCTRTPCCQHPTLDTMGICDGTRTHRACMCRRSKVTVFVRNLCRCA